MSTDTITARNRRAWLKRRNSEIVNVTNVLGAIALTVGGLKAEDFRVICSVAITEQMLPRVGSVLGVAWRDLAEILAGPAQQTEAQSAGGAS